MTLFALEPFERIAAKIRQTTGISRGEFRMARYENGEFHLEVQTPVKREECLILGSIAPPDLQLLSVLLLAHTLKKEGARRVTAMLPYLAYARHDKDKPGESLTTAWVGALTHASGIDRVVAVDVHSERAKKLFPIPVFSLSPAQIFAQALKVHGLTRAAIVAPDEGAVARCADVKRAGGIAPGPVPYFEKHRNAAGITHSALIGEAGSSVVLIDDILDTGGTLLSACERLAGAGVKELTIMVTHGLFTGDRWKGLWNLGVRRIFCTDSVPLAPELDCERIEQLSVIPLLEGEITALAGV